MLLILLFNVFMGGGLEDLGGLVNELAPADPPREARPVETITAENHPGGADERVARITAPLDRTIYLDLSFLAQLRSQFGARGDLAPAYVVSHEFGHHIQTIGVAKEIRSLQDQEPGIANELSVAMELQADYFVGVWLSSVAVDSSAEVEEGYIEIDAGEISEAMEAAEAVGDDRVQAQATGTVSWTHGSADQRVAWLQQSVDSGDPGRYDTFAELP